MRVGIVGNKKCRDQLFVLENIAHIFDTHALDEFDIHAKRITVITGGEPEGISAFASDFAGIYGLDVIQFEPYFVADRQATHSPRHYFIRNKQLVDNVDQLLVFAYGNDSSDRHLIKYAREKGKEVFVVELKESHISEQNTRKEINRGSYSRAVGV